MGIQLFCQKRYKRERGWTSGRATPPLPPRDHIFIDSDRRHSQSQYWTWEGEGGTSGCNSFNFSHRLQNSPYFCVFKYARAVKRKVWNEAENRERDWGETLRALRGCEARELRARKTQKLRFTDFFTDFQKKPTVLQSTFHIDRVMTFLVCWLFYPWLCVYLLMISYNNILFDVIWWSLVPQHYTKTEIDCFSVS